MADAPVYQVARATLKSAELLLQHSARGDQDEMLAHAMSAICHAAIVCGRLGDPLGPALLGYLEQRLKDEETWGALARGRARLERALSELGQNEPRNHEIWMKPLTGAATELDDETPEGTLAQLEKERDRLGPLASPELEDLDERIATLRMLIAQSTTQAQRAAYAE